MVLLCDKIISRVSCQNKCEYEKNKHQNIFYTFLSFKRDTIFLKHPVVVVQSGSKAENHIITGTHLQFLHPAVSL